MNCYPQYLSEIVNSLRFKGKDIKRKETRLGPFCYLVFLLASAAFMASSSFC